MNLFLQPNANLKGNIFVVALVLPNVQNIFFFLFFQGSVEFVESDTFEIHINTTAPSVDELARVHCNYSAVSGSVLLQMVSIDILSSQMMFYSLPNKLKSTHRQPTPSLSIAKNTDRLKSGWHFGIDGVTPPETISSYRNTKCAQISIWQQTETQTKDAKPSSKNHPIKNQVLSNTNMRIFVSVQFESDPVVIESPLKFIVLIIGGSTVLVFLCTIIFVCWWNVYRKPFIKETKIFNPGKEIYLSGETLWSHRDGKQYTSCQLVFCSNFLNLWGRCEMFFSLVAMNPYWVEYLDKGGLLKMSFEEIFTTFPERGLSLLKSPMLFWTTPHFFVEHHLFCVKTSELGVKRAMRPEVIMTYLIHVFNGKVFYLPEWEVIYCTVPWVMFGAQKPNSNKWAFTKKARMCLFAQIAEYVSRTM